MSGLSRDSPTNRGYYAESTQARALTIGDLALCSLMLKHVLLVGEVDEVGVLELGHVGEDQEGTTCEKREAAD